MISSQSMQGSPEAGARVWRQVDRASGTRSARSPAPGWSSERGARSPRPGLFRETHGGPIQQAIHSENDRPHTYMLNIISILSNLTHARGLADSQRMDIRLEASVLCLKLHRPQYVLCSYGDDRLGRTSFSRTNSQLDHGPRNRISSRLKRIVFKPAADVTFKMKYCEIRPFLAIFLRKVQIFSR